MADPYPIRPVGPDEFDAFYAVDLHAFHGRPMPDQRRAEVIRLFEFDRSLVAFDGDSPVGISGVYSLRMCLPGAMAPVAGVTFIAVLPTHRRRGILSSLIRRQFAHIRDRGEAIAVLWSSEAGIYGRYGYGAASWHSTFTFGRNEGELGRQAPPAGPGLRLRLAEPESVRAELAKIYETMLPTRPGMFARDELWWNRVLATADEGQADTDPLRCLLAEDDNGPRGYALYSGTSRWDGQTFLADSALSISEMLATDSAATAAIWADLLSRDLTTEFPAELRPADDPLLHMLADPRRARPRVSDGLWGRLPGRRGHRGDRRDAAAECGPVAAQHVGPARGGSGTGPGGQLRVVGRARRHDPRRQRARRRLPGRHPAGRPGRSRSRGRAPSGGGRRAVGGHVLGPRALVPDDLLSRAGLGRGGLAGGWAGRGRAGGRRRPPGGAAG